LSYRIPFNRPYVVGDELAAVARSVADGSIGGDGPFTRECQALMERAFAATRVLLTTSCTSALEMAALLCDIEPGDEVILPSYTFVSTANAFLLRGATLRFVDIRPDTLNLDEQLLSRAITARTKVIVPVHYASIGCEMTVIGELARTRGLHVIEDAAQAVNAIYRGAYLGTLGTLGTYSFHSSKNFSCGEGGALVINDASLTERAEIIREKGTNRSRFFRGQVDKYTWIDRGSSYVPADILAAYLLTQLQHMGPITAQRRRVWERYLGALQPLASRGLLALPTIPAHCGSNYHMFYALTDNLATRTALLDALKAAGILAVFHYVPLHTAPVGQSLGYGPGTLPVTESISDRLLRLPLYPTLTDDEIDDVVRAIYSFYRVQPPAEYRA
jgi:dTDP-4-amino-4,6-dideoxygalactose transaminase